MRVFKTILILVGALISFSLHSITFAEDQNHNGSQVSEVSTDRVVTALNRWSKEMDAQTRASAETNTYQISAGSKRSGEAFTHLAKGFYRLLPIGGAPRWKDAGFQFLASALNPFGLLNSLVSDVGALAKGHRYVNQRVSSRIQICTGNLGLTNSGSATLEALLNPFDHVGVLIDGSEMFEDPGGGGIDTVAAHNGADCSPVPILSQEPESVVIERLTYIADRLGFNYSFVAENCGYFTREVLDAAGLAYPILPNLGIGAEIPLSPNLEKTRAERQQVRADLDRYQSEADEHLDDFRKVISSISANRVPDVAFSDQLPVDPKNPDVHAMVPFSLDAYLELVSIASRSSNPAVRDWVKSSLLEFFDLKRYGPAIANRSKSPSGRNAINLLFEGLTWEDVAWFAKGSDDRQKILDLLQLPSAVRSN